MGNVSELKDDIAELKRNTDNVMVDDIELPRAEFTVKNKVIESLILS